MKRNQVPFFFEMEINFIKKFNKGTSSKEERGGLGWMKLKNTL